MPTEHADFFETGKYSIPESITNYRNNNELQLDFKDTFRVKRSLRYHIISLLIPCILYFEFDYVFKL